MKKTAKDLLVGETYATITTTMKYVHMVGGDLVDAVNALSRTARKVQDSVSEPEVASARANVVPFDNTSR